MIILNQLIYNQLIKQEKCLKALKILLSVIYTDYLYKKYINFFLTYVCFV